MKKCARSGVDPQKSLKEQAEDLWVLWHVALEDSVEKMHPEDGLALWVACPPLRIRIERSVLVKKIDFTHAAVCLAVDYIKRRDIESLRELMRPDAPGNLAELLREPPAWPCKRGPVEKIEYRVSGEGYDSDGYQAVDTTQVMLRRGIKELLWLFGGKWLFDSGFVAEIGVPPLPAQPESDVQKTAAVSEQERGMLRRAFHAACMHGVDDVLGFVSMRRIADRNVLHDGLVSACLSGKWSIVSKLTRMPYAYHLRRPIGSRNDLFDACARCDIDPMDLPAMYPCALLAPLSVDQKNLEKYSPWFAAVYYACTHSDTKIAVEMLQGQFAPQLKLFEHFEDWNMFYLDLFSIAAFTGRTDVAAIIMFSLTKIAPGGFRRRRSNPRADDADGGDGGGGGDDDDAAAAADDDDISHAETAEDGDGNFEMQMKFAITEACARGHSGIVRLCGRPEFKKVGAKYSVRKCLYYACMYGRAEVVDVLASEPFLATGAMAIHVKTNMFRTPLAIAVVSESKETFERLFSPPFSLDPRNPTVRRVITHGAVLACATGRYGLMEMLALPPYSIDVAKVAATAIAPTVADDDDDGSGFSKDDALLSAILLNYSMRDRGADNEMQALVRDAQTFATPIKAFAGGHSKVFNPGPPWLSSLEQVTYRTTDREGRFRAYMPYGPGYTPIMPEAAQGLQQEFESACMHGDAESISAKFFVNRRRSMIRKADAVFMMMCACANGRADVLRDMGITRTWDVVIAGIQHDTEAYATVCMPFLSLACASGNPEVLDILAKTPFSMGNNEIEAIKYSTIISACAGGRSNIIRTLVAEPYSITTLSAEHFISALMISTEMDDTAAVSILTGSALKVDFSDIELLISELFDSLYLAYHTGRIGIAKKIAEFIRRYASDTELRAQQKQ